MLLELKFYKLVLYLKIEFYLILDVLINPSSLETIFFSLSILVCSAFTFSYCFNLELYEKIFQKDKPNNNRYIPAIYYVGKYKESVG